MAPIRETRRSRRLSHKSPMEVADYDWQGTAPLQLATTPSAVHPLPPSPSECTTTTTDAPPSPPIVTHLPFAPGSSHTRNRKRGHVPRPPNAFMVFRSWLWNKDNLKSIEKDNRNVSRIAGRYWNELSEAERAPFRCMAEEAKARHTQLYPEYKYAPGSQKKHKVSQRRSQRDAERENEKCKQLAAALMSGGVASCDLPMHVGEGQGTSALVAEQTSSGSLAAAPRKVTKRPAVPRGESTLPRLTSDGPNTLPAPLVPTLPSQYAGPLPVLPLTEERFETAQFPGPLARTPELTFPADDMAGFVATDDIPYLSLDTCNGLTVSDGDLDLSSFFPSHLMPGSDSIFSGVKPEAASFVDSCVLGAHTSDVLALPTDVQFGDFDIEPFPSLPPLGSPVFSNPFDPSSSTAAHSELFCTLDQLFGQPISPLTSDFL